MSAALRTRIEELEEEIRQLKAAFAPKVGFPHAWRLDDRESTILSALFHAKGSYVTPEALLLLIVRYDDDADEGTTRKWVGRIRRKVEPHGDNDRHAAPAGIHPRRFWPRRRRRGARAGAGCSGWGGRGASGKASARLVRGRRRRGAGRVCPPGNACGRPVRADRGGVQVALARLDLAARPGPRDDQRPGRRRSGPRTRTSSFGKLTRPAS